MSLLERAHCFILLAQDKIDCDETGHLEPVVEMSLFERVDCIIMLAQDEIQNVVSRTPLSTACRRDVSVRKS